MKLERKGNKRLLQLRFSWRVFYLFPGMKRQMEDNEEEHNGGSGDGPTMKKRRGEGPHVECRILLASKVRRSNHPKPDLFFTLPQNSCIPVFTV